MNILDRIRTLERRHDGHDDCCAATSTILPAGRMLFDVYGIVNGERVRVAHDVPQSATRHCAVVLIDPDPDV